MTTAVQSSAGPPSGGAGGSSLADVVETILDKGLVIDANVSVSIVGIQLLTIDARVVIASVDTYLRFAEATNRLDLSRSQGKGVPELVGDTKKAKAIGSAGEKVGEILGEIVGGGDRQSGRRRERER